MLHVRQHRFAFEIDSCVVQWQHVQFEGYDEDETGLTYGGSIPIDKAVDALGDCLVCMIVLPNYQITNPPNYKVPNSCLTSPPPPLPANR